MRNRKQKIKYILLLCVFSMFLIASCKRSETGKTVESKEVINAQWENAAHTPYGKYPELVTYTLGKIVGSNNANLPVKATYEDNAYTRYLKERLNIQNEDVLEGENSDSYEEAVGRSAAAGSVGGKRQGDSQRTGQAWDGRRSYHSI